MVKATDQHGARSSETHEEKSGFAAGLLARVRVDSQR